MPTNPALSAEPEPALRLITLYKLVKAGVVLVAAMALTSLLLTGSSADLHDLATDLRQHVSAAWSVYLSEILVKATERRHLVVAASALFLDGGCTSLEWYALSRGSSRGEWLVVIATMVFLPWEVLALVRHVHLGRAALLVVNLAVVAYLAHHARERDKRGRRARPLTS